MNHLDAANIQEAIKVFVHGFCFTRSLMHPYLAEQKESLWVMHDAPRRSGKYRVEEWVAFGLPAREIDHIVRKYAKERYVISIICGVNESQETIRDDFKSLGYRLRTTEALMTHRLVEIPPSEPTFIIERVQTAEQAAILSGANRSRPLEAEYFGPDSVLRQYMALIDGDAVGWARSIRVDDSIWCADVYVKPPFRRHGIARSILSKLLLDAAGMGIQTAVLTASHAGSALYPVVGFEQIGTLLSYQPAKSQKQLAIHLPSHEIM